METKVYNLVVSIYQNGDIENEVYTFRSLEDAKSKLKDVYEEKKEEYFEDEEEFERLNDVDVLNDEDFVIVVWEWDDLCVVGEIKETEIQ
jgi:hypothetical protein